MPHICFWVLRGANYFQLGNMIVENHLQSWVESHEARDRKMSGSVIMTISMIKSEG
jgi:hypothetical protein